MVFMKSIVFVVAFILICTNAASLNASFSEPGMAFTFNSHLVGWSGE